MEKFQEHPTCPGYMVGDQGTVYNPKGNKVTAFRATDNYWFIQTYRDGDVKRHILHRFIAQAWLEQGESKTCRFIDGNRSNVLLDNIEWAGEARVIRIPSTDRPIVKASPGLKLFVLKRIEELKTEEQELEKVVEMDTYRITRTRNIHRLIGVRDALELNINLSRTL